MQQSDAIKIVSRSPEETEDLARKIADVLVVGDVILLTGDIGAGKSLFSRALIKHRLAAVGIAEDVPSPTYTLVQTYDDGAVEIWHADLYRLAHAFEVVELGLTDAFESAICLVEWPDRLGAYTPTDAINIEISEGPTEQSRHIRFSSSSDRWKHIQPVLTKWGL